jgi:cytochrome c-type biogenesis protein CcmH
MVLWIAFALLTAAVLAWVLAPLAQPAPAPDDATGSAEAGTRAVYRDQLAEVDAERASGLIGAAEAEAAKLEISRRLLASAAPADADTPAQAVRGMAHSRVALASAVTIPLLTLALYLAHGSPGMPSGPVAARTAAPRDDADLARMVAQVEARLRKTPDDGKGWEVIAPVYLKSGRYADAASAYANALRLQGESVKLLSGLAEASMLSREGVVTEEARSAYERLLKLEPGMAEPRFWLAMGKEQDGRLAEALADYKGLLDEAPPGAAYRTPLDARIREVSTRLAGTAPKEVAKAPAAGAAKEPPGPTAAAIDAAAKLSPEQRGQMVTGMVEGLAQRLKSDGRDLPGWLRLVRAYSVLGRNDDARAALAEARRNFAGDKRALSDLSQLATTLGLDS